MTFSVVSSFIFFLLVGNQHVDTSEDEIVVLLKAEVLQKRLELTCYVSKLQHDVEFIDPSGKIRAYCIAPIPSIPAECNPKDVTTQYFEKKLTKLMLSPISVSDFGEWKCKHGTNRGYDSVTVSRVSTEQEDDISTTSCDSLTNETKAVTINPTDISEESKNGVGFAIAIVFALAGPTFLILCCYLKFSKKGNRQLLYARTGSERLPLLDEEEDNKTIEDKTIQNCNNCKKHTRFCYCYECGKSFCEICIKKVHFKYMYNNHSKNSDHHIIQFHHYPESNEDIKLPCQDCNVHNVSKVCFKCTENHARCLKCHCAHQASPSDVLQALVAYTTKLEEQESEKVSEKSSIDLTKSKPRIRSLALLNENTVLVTDFWRKRLIYSNGKQIHQELQLSSEPRGLVRLDKPDTFAVTFGYEHKIRFYEINQQKCLLSEHGEPLTVKGHPFQIAHHKGLFAVEMNEGRDGKIVIMAAQNGAVERTIPNNDYNIGYFTGNSLRLALNKDKEDLYVSAIGKQTLFCLNFEGHIKWQIQIPSPRSVVEIPGKDLFATRILLASQRSQKIFNIKCRKSQEAVESYKVEAEDIDFGDLKSPDFMEYCMTKGGDGKHHEYVTVEADLHKVKMYELS